MQSFEKYHPIMSVHYTMDWLTMFKIKDVFRLRADQQIAAESGRQFDQKITDTARYINRSMRLVMSNNALLYGIKDRGTNDFLGSFCIWNFSEKKTIAQIRFETLAAYQGQGIMTEVLKRMLGFAFFELGLKEVYVILPATNDRAANLLTANFFTQVGDYRHERTLPDGSKVPLVRYELTADAVADKEDFHF
ncbi:N-acetyltransferase [Lacticaseibacillus chiayiensis]|uniref:N-acetyltransferase n=1 Tax=Lacticaseibacillus chiayiensis TaxID=2100821 RepID=A0A4Q1U0J4_9LACO|nr:GNAT family N-acetyltransferase [Lacticaseibacillus chiayiensis]QVI34898.1 GNAT family N-acetyltransferase [Lacticaseibacillus chiayiensis]RXT24954.1 N-acetyltransferase [Lacticaseibacillus chiayiensis]UYN56656.1 GNAT family N-acetyltransferase [Lacticaseibacillus chiayiensis]